MNVLEELRSLDINEPGRWPLVFRIAAAVLVLAVVSAVGIWQFVVRVEVPELERVRDEETTLRASFEGEQAQAANYDEYVEQLATIRRDFGTMLGKLPGETEVDDLLLDISQTASAVGLEVRLFDPDDNEIQREFYAELRIVIRYEGTYHQIAEFISGVAALPRIVTIHDMRITPIQGSGGTLLRFDAVAKTYRYLEEELV